MRAVEWRHMIAERVCDVVRPWEHGAVVRATDFPTYYQFNFARLEGGDPGLDAEALAAGVEPAFEGLEHRRIDVEDCATGERLAPGFAAMGWVVERLAFLERALPAEERDAPAGATVEVGGFEISRPLRRAWQGESIWSDPPEFFEVEEAAAARIGTRSVVASV